MRIVMDVSLDPTLGCGQAHRWRKTDGVWKGTIDNKLVALTEREDGFDCSGNVSRSAVESYFRVDDDFDCIIASISEKDPYVASLAEKHRGLRILRQEKWECLGTYLLATNANVKRIASMVNSVCNAFGTDLGGVHAFPKPRQILDRPDLIGPCKLGFREKRFMELAQRAEDGEIDFDGISDMDYRGCVKELMTLNGVGPKVADCVALFAFDHLQAFPIDARISKCMEDRYGITGNYRKVSEASIAKFGEYAGYAQEYLYHGHVS